ncbi:MAG: xanthine dehydrogenase family protein molybdopterin-binding subunit, partial [Vicinamibacterales bacterium]
MNTTREFKYIGTRPIRHDGLDKVTGRATYGADFTLPGMLHGCLLRSPHAHARIVSIDTSAAEKMPGVRAVVTGADIPKSTAFVMGEAGFNLGHMGDNLLAHDKALYEGHAVAAVAATSLDAARAAADAIRVVYEVLPPAMSIEQALAPGAPILHDDLVTKGTPLPDAPKRTNVAMRMELKRGDVEKGFAEADLIVEQQLTTPTVHQGYIEPHACVARYGENGQVFVWTTTQGQFLVRDCCAGILGIDAATIKVVPSEIGGGFGGKIPIYLEPVAIALSRKAHRPVKLVMSRDEVFRATGPTSGSRIRTKIGVKHDGTIVAATVSLHYEAGAYPGSPAGAGAMCALASYRIPNFFVEAFDVVVNRPKVAAYRAPGSPASSFGTESVLDEIARRLNMDPLALRLKNAVAEGDQAPYGPKFGTIGLRQVLEAAMSHPHWTAPKAPHTGRGVAAGFWFNAGLSSTATVSISGDGSATVVAGNPDIGG